MTDADKRGQLSSRLLAAKSGDVPSTRRGGGALKLATEAEAKPAETDAALLYNKGDASASTFRPSYWTYDRKSGTETSGGATVTPISPAVVGKLTVEPARAPRAVALPRRRWYRRTGNIVVLTFTGAALLATAAFFALSMQRAPTPTQVAETPTTPTPPVVVPLQPSNSAPVPAAPEPIAAAPAAPIPASPAPAAPVEPTATASVPAPVSAAPAPVSPAPAQPPIPAAAPSAATEAAPASTEVAPASTETAPAPAAAAPAASASADRAIASTTSAAQDVQPLITRGDQLRTTGDFAAARLFYERAAEQGSAAAARAVGETYDPAVLEEAHALGVRGDAEAAARWYRRAIAGGDPVAELRLQNLMAKKTAN